MGRSNRGRSSRDRISWRKSSIRRSSRGLRVGVRAIGVGSVGVGPVGLGARARTEHPLPPYRNSVLTLGPGVPLPGACFTLHGDHSSQPPPEVR